VIYPDEFTDCCSAEIEIGMSQRGRMFHVKFKYAPEIGLLPFEVVTFDLFGDDPVDLNNEGLDLAWKLHQMLKT
jgi:hypothetical protein